MSSTNYNNTLKDFKHDLKMLLQKYDAIIGIDVKGDTYGIHDVRLTVAFWKPLEPNQNWRTTTKEFTLTYGYSLGKNDM